MLRKLTQLCVTIVKTEFNSIKEITESAFQEFPEYIQFKI